MTLVVASVTAADPSAVIGNCKAYSPVAGLVCAAVMGISAIASAQSQPTQAPRGEVTAYVVMTPSGPATCATWGQWRAPGANPTDREIIQYWAEGYISGLAAGSHHNILGQFRLPDLGAWLDRYCAANPQVKLPLAINALGRDMLAHPGGKP